MQSSLLLPVNQINTEMCWAGICCLSVKLCFIIACSQSLHQSRSETHWIWTRPQTCDSWNQDLSLSGWAGLGVASVLRVKAEDCLHACMADSKENSKPFIQMLMFVHSLLRLQGDRPTCNLPFAFFHNSIPQMLKIGSILNGYSPDCDRCSWAECQGDRKSTRLNSSHIQ